MIAKWNGSAWSALGSNGAGDGAITDFVYAAVVSGTDLYVGGIFSNAAGIPAADYIARWDGNAWSALGSNGTDDGALDNVVYAIAPSGNTLYVGGNFENAAGIATADFIAQWDGNAWSALGSNGFGEGALLNKLGGVDALEVSGSDLYVGGSFPDAAGIAEADYVAKWDGLAWSALGSNGSGNGAPQQGRLRPRALGQRPLRGWLVHERRWQTNRRLHSEVGPG